VGRRGAECIFAEHRLLLLRQVYIGTDLPPNLRRDNRSLARDRLDNYRSDHGAFGLFRRG